MWKTSTGRGNRHRRTPVGKAGDSPMEGKRARFERRTRNRWQFASGLALTSLGWNCVSRDWCFDDGLLAITGRTTIPCESRGKLFKCPISKRAMCEMSPANRRDVTSRCARRTFSFNLGISLRSQFSSALRPIEPFASSNTHGEVSWSAWDCFSRISLDTHAALFVEATRPSPFAPSSVIFQWSLILGRVKTTLTWRMPWCSNEECFWILQFSIIPSAIVTRRIRVDNRICVIYFRSVINLKMSRRVFTRF